MKNKYIFEFIGEDENLKYCIECEDPEKVKNYLMVNIANYHDNKDFLMRSIKYGSGSKEYANAKNIIETIRNTNIVKLSGIERSAEFFSGIIYIRYTLLDEWVKNMEMIIL